MADELSRTSGSRKVSGQPDLDDRLSSACATIGLVRSLPNRLERIKPRDVLFPPQIGHSHWRVHAKVHRIA